ncbi:MAG: SpoIIE family protein phosphatase [Coriobacteriales bacterium]|nr:SpoIIE family protein phosphatase [Coriobacteriales bacterium]
MANEKPSRSTSQLFWGRTSELPLHTRICGLAFIAATITSMAFCQLGFWSMGEVNNDPVYFNLLLAPVIMGSIAFGPITGGLIGVFGGLVAYVHGTLLPLDFLEAYFFGSPLNTVGLFGFVAVVAGILFDLALRRHPQGARRVLRIVAVGVAVSFLASGLSLANMVMLIGGFELFTFAHWYLYVSVLASTLQALADSVLIVLLCLATDHLIRKIQERGSNRPLFSVFRNFLVVISAIVFMTASAVIFSNTTIQEIKVAYDSMDNELAYLCDQLNFQPNADAQLLIGGYDAPTEGALLTTDGNGVIRASNDDVKFKVGTSLLTDIGLKEYLDDASFVEALLQYYSSGREPIVTVQNTDDDLTASLDLALLGVRKYKDGYLVLHRTTDLIFADRFGTMAAAAGLALSLVASTALLASFLVRRLIVRRIEEANLALARITDGHLDERVPAQSTREFMSLANGINSTVEALGNMIDEVERRNEQDLATAKIIQESSLPAEFPAFPHIKTFDIYASMKTAKEVGGDFYDFFPLEDTTKIGFVMADVSGKGIPAALFMMAARSQLRNYLEAGMPVDEAVAAANHQLCMGNDAGMFVTAWVGELDYETGEVVFANGGHNPPLHMHDGTWSWVNERSGLPLGLFDGLPYTQYTLRLEPGDILYTYTDGVNEAMSTVEEQFGNERMEKVLKTCTQMSPRSIDNTMRHALDEFTRDAEQSDDITMLTIKFGVPPT